MRHGVETADDLESAEITRLGRRTALLHGALLVIAALGDAEVHRAPEIARRALERPHERD